MKTRFKLTQFKALAAAALVTSSFAFSAHALPITNGGFETGDLHGWNTAPGYIFDGGVTSAEAYAGSYSLELGSQDIVYQELSTPKRFGLLRFKAKADDPSWIGYADVWVIYRDGTTSKLIFNSDLVSGHWEIFELDLEFKPIYRIYFELGSSAPIYIDSVALLD